MAEFELSRSTTIDAPASVIYPLIANFHEWPKWSPWEGLDPNLERTYRGPESGVGTAYAWSGNRKAGAGEMEITHATESSKVVLDLRFFKPFKAENVATFELTETGGSTTVSWVMRGPNPLLFRLLAPLIRMEKTVGGDFEKGLAAMKATAEGADA